MKQGTLYQRILGDDFERLPLVLQRFHSLSKGSHATGYLKIESGRSLIQQGAARLLGLPKPSINTPIRLEVIPEGATERWVRHFGSQCIESLQWEEDGFLVEQVGSLLFYFTLVGSETGLEFVFHQNRMQRWSIPTLLSLGVSAAALALPPSEEHWDIQVKFRSQLLGTLTTYSGTIRPAI